MEHIQTNGLRPETVKKYEAFMESMIGAVIPEWGKMPMSINQRRSLCRRLGSSLPDEIKGIEASITADNTPLGEMYRYMAENAPYASLDRIKAIEWIFPASWQSEVDNMEAYKEAYFQGYAYYLDRLHDEELKTFAPFSLSFAQMNERFENVMKEHINAYMEYRFPRIERKLHEAIKKAIVLLFVADNSDETEIGYIYSIAKRSGLKPGQTLSLKDMKALDTVAESVFLIIEFWALNFGKWVALNLSDEGEERQYLSEAEGKKHNVNPYLFGEVADVFELFITAYHKAAVAGIQSSGEEYLNIDFEALLSSFAEGWEATERIGGYNSLLDKVNNSRYEEYYNKF